MCDGVKVDRTVAIGEILGLSLCVCACACVHVYRMCAGGCSAVLLHMVLIGGLLGVRCVVAVCCCSLLQWKDLLKVDY